MPSSSSGQFSGSSARHGQLYPVGQPQQESNESNWKRNNASGSTCSSDVGGVKMRSAKRKSLMEGMVAQMSEHFNSITQRLLRAALHSFLELYTNMKGLEYVPETEYASTNSQCMAAIRGAHNNLDDNLNENAEEEDQREEKTGFAQVFELRRPEPEEPAVYKQWQMAPLPLERRPPRRFVGAMAKGGARRSFTSLQAKWAGKAGRKGKSSKKPRAGDEETTSTGPATSSANYYPLSSSSSSMAAAMKGNPRRGNFNYSGTLHSTPRRGGGGEGEGSYKLKKVEGEKSLYEAFSSSLSPKSRAATQYDHHHHQQSRQATPPWGRRGGQELMVGSGDGGMVEFDEEEEGMMVPSELGRRQHQHSQYLDDEEGDMEDMDSILSSEGAPSTIATTATTAVNIDMEKRLAELESKLAALVASNQSDSTSTSIGGKGNSGLGGVSTTTAMEGSGNIGGSKEKEGLPAGSKIPPPPPPPPPGLLLPPGRKPPPMLARASDKPQTQATSATGATTALVNSSPPVVPGSPPTKNTSSSSATSSISSLSSVGSKENAAAATATTTTMDMRDVLRDLGNAMGRLRKVERSPGGTPMTAKLKCKGRPSLAQQSHPLAKPRKAPPPTAGQRVLFKEEVEEKMVGENDSKENSSSNYHAYDFMCEALRRKFENTRLNEEEEEEEEEDGEEEESVVGDSEGLKKALRQKKWKKASVGPSDLSWAD